MNKTKALWLSDVVLLSQTWLDPSNSLVGDLQRHPGLYTKSLTHKSEKATPFLWMTVSVTPKSSAFQISKFLTRCAKIGMYKEGFIQVVLNIFILGIFKCRQHLLLGFLQQFQVEVTSHRKTTITNFRKGADSVRLSVSTRPCFMSWTIEENCCTINKLLGLVEQVAELHFA